MNRPIQSRIQQKVYRENYNFPRSLPSTMPTPIFHNHELYTFDKNATNINNIQHPILTKNRNNHPQQPQQSQQPQQHQQPQQSRLTRQIPNRVQVVNSVVNEYYLPLPNQLPNKPYSQPDKNIKQQLNRGEKDQDKKNGGYQDRNFFSMPEPVQNFKFKENNMNYRLQNFHSLNKTFQNEEINKFYDNNPTNARRDIYEESRNDDDEKFIRLQGGPINNIMDNKGSMTRSQKIIVNNYVPIKRNLAIPPEAIQ